MKKNKKFNTREQIKVSVIIAAYNAENTIRDTLNSLLAQTFTFWEAIVVDDGSNDNTDKIVSEYIERDNRFHLFKQENKGESSARNAGIKLARFDWMLFLDSDDWILPAHLEYLTNLVGNNRNLDGAYCGWTYCTPDNKYVFPSYGKESGQLFVQHAGYCFSIVNSYLIKSSLVKEACGFELSLKTCADWDMWQRITRTGARFGVVPDILAIYRIRAGSATRDGYQLFSDGLKVINQGHSPDQRVSRSHPLYINGNSKEELIMRKFELVCACAGYLIGGKNDALPLLDLLNGERCYELDAYSLADCLFRHTMISSSQPLSDWGKIWPEFEKPVQNFLRALELCSGTPKLEQNAVCLIQHLAGSYADKNNSFNKLLALKSRLAVSFYRHKTLSKRIKQFGKRLTNFPKNKILSAN